MNLYSNFKGRVYNSQENAKSAAIAGLDLAIPDAYKRVAGVGVSRWMYRTTGDPRAFISELRCLYGRLSPTERETMDTKWSES